MHLLSSVVATETTLCASGIAAMAYWRWRAVMDQADSAEIQFIDSVEQIFSAPVPSIQSWRYTLVKRGIDLLLSSLILVLFAVPGCIIAALIALTSRGPVFYREMRIGRYGYQFKIWKFRSMYLDGDHRSRMSHHESSEAHLFWRMRKSSLDPRITTIGRFLRCWSLDELPQLINVLNGEMSLIGPRPIVEAEIGPYGKLISAYIEVTPGLSGLWQVSGRSNIGYAQRAELDARYARTWSLVQDFNIFLRTFPAVLRRIGAQ